MCRSIFPRRPSTTCQQLPRQPAAANGDARVLGPLPHRHWGLWASSPLCAQATHADLRAPLSGDEWQLGSCLFRMPARGPSRPLRHLVGFRVAALQHVPPLSGGRRPLTHSPRREVVSGPANTEGAHPTASGRLAGVALFWQSALL